MAESRSKKYSLMMFLITLFIVLAIFLGSYIYKTYSSSIAFSTEGTESVMNCGSYSYKISELDLDEDKLFFVLENSAGDSIEYLIIESGDYYHKEFIAGIGHGEKRELELTNVSVSGVVEFYPEGCKKHNSKKFKIS
ncbi:hypothetical protein HN587_07780 [Candidatus Woesearchaeota archaeon]|nr:hypothetical protein [Candidatus Woesearchaeota archaeon]